LIAKQQLDSAKYYYGKALVPPAKKRLYYPQDFAKGMAGRYQRNAPA